jgi:valyl-tRNA synthetase
MGLQKRYRPNQIEPEWMDKWELDGTNHFEVESDRPPYTIDTPPPTVSGKLHLGHVYSYSHADFLARFWRMNGRNVLYPMGYDDNGLPTALLVERTLDIRPKDVGRQAFIEKCLEVSIEAEKDYEALWKRLGLSIDWRFTYRTIDERSRRLCQLSFIDLYEKGLAYRKLAPSIWCPTCETAIAQAELDDMERSTEFVTLKFMLEDGSHLPIATTRPELLPACVAVFVHPDDPRFQHLIGHDVRVPYFDQMVSIFADAEADPEKGTGAVMCCTFGDTADVSWWYRYDLALVEAIQRNGLMTPAAREFKGMPIAEARKAIRAALEEKELITGTDPADQSVRVHERCDTPVEYVVASQWFIRVLDFKEELIELGSKVSWYPSFMQKRFQQWVENLNWDWCISRQRFFGVTFPVWYCRDCGDIHVAERGELPMDPTISAPPKRCHCGGTAFDPEEDVMDTWATSSLSPQLVASWLGQSGFDQESFVPISMRPQAHEIIRTWAFYSIVKAYHHFGEIPWHEAAISGWALSEQGTQKISKSRGGGPAPPLEMLELYSADAVRYWAASTSLGKDAVISEEKILAGSKLINKLWNVARFSSRFIGDEVEITMPQQLTPADQWILSKSDRLIKRVTDSLIRYDYATAKAEIETFFWNDLADNYLEMAKRRLYDDGDIVRKGAVYTLNRVLLSVLKLFAPFLPYVTEEIYTKMFVETNGRESIDFSEWPQADDEIISDSAEEFGSILVEIATAVRRYKSEEAMSLGAELSKLVLSGLDQELLSRLTSAESDLISITRAKQLVLIEGTKNESNALATIGTMQISVVN